MYLSRVFAILLAFTVLFSSVQIDLESVDLGSGPELGKQDAANAEELSNSISTSEWLGPLAPIALSPFFGITCLSAMNLFGEGTILANNQFVSSNPVLGQQAVFWTFLVLTLLTSLPRLTKVSKPLAQILDQVETYAGIITLIVIRIAASTEPGAADATAMTEPAFIQMGILSFSGDALLMVAAAINIFVINMVKFFFEVLIWMTPFPMVDAIFEACNKVLCVGLMAIYAWSPVAATILNLALFAICAMAFRWIYRNVVYMRAILTDPVWKLVNQSFGSIGDNHQLTVFAQSKFGPFPAKAKLLIKRTDSGWNLVRRSPWFFPSTVLELSSDNTEFKIVSGFFLNKLIATGSEEFTLVFTRRYAGNLPEVAQKMGFTLPDTEESTASVSIA